MRRAIFLTLIINTFCITFSIGQSLHQTLEFANKLYEKQEYQTAVEAYKRTLFFDKEETYSPLIFNNMAESLYHLGQYEEAAYYYELAYFSNEDDFIKNVISLRRISCFLILKQPQYAQVELFNLPDSLTVDQERTRRLYLAMIDFALEDYNGSESAFMQIAPDSNKIAELFYKNERINRLKPKTAKVLSIILPGLGQFYAGDIKNGLNSMLLTGGLFFLGIRSGIRYSFIDAAISALPWIQRYYMGGYQKAEKIAEAKIKERRYKIFNELLSEVE